MLRTELDWLEIFLSFRPIKKNEPQKSVPYWTTETLNSHVSVQHMLRSTSIHVITATKVGAFDKLVAELLVIAMFKPKESLRDALDGVGMRLGSFQN